jgi:cell division septal protein FtsQ
MRPFAGRRRLPLALALVGLVVLVPLVVYATGRRTSSFDVRRIVVGGQRPAHTRELRATLTEAFLGENLFGIDGGDVGKALSGFPYVAAVAVDRDFPQTLRVRVTEYVPAALLHAGGDWYVVSSDGRVFAAAAPSPSPTPSGQATAGSDLGATPTPSTSTTALAGSASPGATSAPSTSASAGEAAGPPPGIPAALLRLPVVTTGAAVTLGEDVPDQRVRDALAVLAALPRRLLSQAATAHASTSSARVTLRSGLQLEFGSADGLTAKMAALAAILGRYQARHVTPTYVDVSTPQLSLARPLLPTASPQ